MAEGGDLSKGLTPLPTDNQWAKSFYGLRKGAPCRNSTVSSDSHFEIVFGRLASVTVIVLSTVNLQFHGQFVPVSLRPILRIVAAHVMATVWSSCC